MTDADRDHVRAVRPGQVDAFGELVSAYQARLYRLVLIMVRERAAAEDVTQDAFVRAYVNLDYYDEARPFYPWLATIAVRLSQNWLRQNARSVRQERADTTSKEPAVADDSISRLMAERQGEALWRAVGALSSGERSAVSSIATR